MTGSQQGVSTMDRFTAAGCQGGNSSRGILSSHSHMSPESVRLMHRHRSVDAAHVAENSGKCVYLPLRPSSPLNLQGSIRHSSSSLSSHTSSEAGNLHIMTDGLMSEHPEDPLHMQVRGHGHASHSLIRAKSHPAANDSLKSNRNCFISNLLLHPSVKSQYIFRIFEYLNIFSWNDISKIVIVVTQYLWYNYQFCHSNPVIVHNYSSGLLCHFHVLFFYYYLNWICLVTNI